MYIYIYIFSLYICSVHIYIYIYMAMSILYLHKDFSKDAHHGKVFEIDNLGPIFICWRPRGSVRISRNHRRGGRAGVPGPWPGPAHGSQRMNMVPKLLIWKTFPWWILEAGLLKETKKTWSYMYMYIHIYIYVLVYLWVTDRH